MSSWSMVTECLCSMQCSEIASALLCVWWLGAEVVAGRARGSISVTASNVCDSAAGTLHTDYTEQVLEYRIEIGYLPVSVFQLDADVTVSRCGGGRRRRRDVNDVGITVVIAGNYASVFICLCGG